MRRQKWDVPAPGGAQQPPSQGSGQAGGRAGIGIVTSINHQAYGGTGTGMTGFAAGPAATAAELAVPPKVEVR